LDHGQLSCLKRHLIISPQGKPTVIDFESSSRIRKTTNVTSVVQNFISSPFLSDKFVGTLTEDKRNDLIRLLRGYKNDDTEERFVKILDFFHALL
jgi:predicted Ser/Thr protein kinase